MSRVSPFGPTWRKEKLSAVSYSLSSTCALQHLWTQAQTYPPQKKKLFLKYCCYSRWNDKFLKLVQWFDSIRQKDWPGLGVEMNPVLTPMSSYYMQFVIHWSEDNDPIYELWKESGIFGELLQEILGYWKDFEPSKHEMYIHKSDILLCWIVHRTEEPKHWRIILGGICNNLNHL